MNDDKFNINIWDQAMKSNLNQFAKRVRADGSRIKWLGWSASERRGNESSSYPWVVPITARRAGCDQLHER